MLEGYRPLDFGFYQAPATNTSGPDIKTIAANLAANSGWTNISHIKTRQTLAKAGKKEQDFLGRVIDLLSVPNYTVANAVDEGLAGVQSNDNDGFLSNVGQFAGGVVTGGLRGAAAGFRGFGSGLIPGLGSDTWAAEPQDKTRFSDVF